MAFSCRSPRRRRFEDWNRAESLPNLRRNASIESARSRAYLYSGPQPPFCGGHTQRLPASATTHRNASSTWHSRRLRKTASQDVLAASSVPLAMRLAILLAVRLQRASRLTLRASAIRPLDDPALTPPANRTPRTSPRLMLRGCRSPHRRRPPRLGDEARPPCAGIPSPPSRTSRGSTSRGSR